ncbi:precorrin-6A/cobalt-precorrin-6A reductase [Microcystis sp. M049S2]|uniref:precorrin-6A/cobalt-precorrin-6A reductase n=1 Tax=Microcystis sp. M049S2 TaxID=2771169 RepID=UPI00258F5EA7|nr:precorrin-6A/cobalt-precorrin-6A reductase [Microcystis sp. M049S2]
MGQLEQCTIKDFCQENNIKLIIDTCHPHAQIIWQLAINYATLANIPLHLPRFRTGFYLSPPYHRFFSRTLCLKLSLPPLAIASVNT